MAVTAVCDTDLLRVCCTLPLASQPSAGYGAETEENIPGANRNASGDQRQLEEQNKAAKKATEGARREGGSETEALTTPCEPTFDGRERAVAGRRLDWTVSL